jgi:hypothetical protein
LNHSIDKLLSVSPGKTILDGLTIPNLRVSDHDTVCHPAEKQGKSMLPAIGMVKKCPNFGPKRPQNRQNPTRRVGKNEKFSEKILNYLPNEVILIAIIDHHTARTATLCRRLPRA